jgi:Zn-dependent peptidase ImmA (M78 family)
VVDLKFGNMSKIYNSEFYNSVVIAIVDNTDYQYQTLAPLFNEHGYGFVAPNQNLVFIDGGKGLSKNTLKWIEAHEVAHIILGHKREKDSKDEIEADTLAHKLLVANGYHKAAKLCKDKFKERHGVGF